MAEKRDKTSLFMPLAMLTGALLLAAAGIAWVQGKGAASGNPGLTGLATVSQSIALQASRVRAGEAEVLPGLAANLAALKELRGATNKLPGNRADWDALTNDATTLVAQSDALQASAAAATEVTTLAPQLLAAAESLLGTAGGSAALQSVQDTTQSLTSAAQAMLSSSDVQSLAAALGNGLAYLRDLRSAFAGESTTLDVAAISDADRAAGLEPFDTALSAIDVSATTLITNAQAVADARNAAARVIASADRLQAPLVNSAADSGSATDGGLLANAYLVPALLLAALLGVLLLVFLYRKSLVFERAAQVQAEQNERNQQAILRLLDELGSLADGDLTVEATVTEDITGAIADSINYAIEKLRELVATINETAIMVDSAAKQTESTAVHMARAAENQNREITAATESIVSMAGSIEEVSGNAERSSDVARHSVDVAHKGGEAVRRTIDGMNTIRETIQDTSKRIKRLGESSQEIGNIVELINDIAEQTNILALNASIQASMAGEAGRGFAVVADEVQRLAERSTNATKQIEVLVRTIQADTNEAVVSMERSTTDVVGGALLAENAGAALDEIEQVSNQIASLVQNISSSAREQAGSAADVTRRTTKLKEISAQTGKATTATAAAISKLSELASQLRSTVAGFTLPTAALTSLKMGGTARPAADESQAPHKDQAVG
ncbi:MAG: methyl-accepting chemotaxis protein [Woeseia sp.]